MQVLICYDVSSNKLRASLVKYLEKFAVRVQYSVFKGELTERKIVEINDYVTKLLADDTYRFNIYKIWDSCNAEVEPQLPKSYIIF